MKDHIELDVQILRKRVIELGTAIDKVVRRHDDAIESLRRQMALMLILGLFALAVVFFVMGIKETNGL